MLQTSSTDLASVVSTSPDPIESDKKEKNEFDNDVITVGDTITLKQTNGIGIVRFIGSIMTKKGIFYGIELNESNGKNDGSFNKIYYFKTKRNHGIFVRKTKIKNKCGENKNMLRITVEDYVFVNKFKCNAIVRFIGTTLFKPGIWYGLQLKKQKGKNNGTINGHKYFKCDNKYGSFVKAKSISIITPKTLIESFLEIRNYAKLIEWLSKDNINILNTFLSYLSRMPQEQKQNNIDLIINNYNINFDEALPKAGPLYSDNEEEIALTKLSYSLTEFLYNEFLDNKVSEFLNNKCRHICVNALLVFHPLSKGNAFHGRVVLESLLKHCPITLISHLTNTNDEQIQILLKCAFLRNIHKGNLNSFLFDLLMFEFEKKKETISILKSKLIKMLIDWKFVDYLLCVGCDAKHDDYVATMYVIFLMELIARMCTSKEGHELFKGNEHLIIDSLMKSVLDKDSKRSIMHKTECSNVLMGYIQILSRETIENPIGYYENFNWVGESMLVNYMHSQLKVALNRLQLYIPQLCDVISNANNMKLKPIVLNSCTIQQPFGQIRYHCFQLLSISIETADFECGKVLKKIKHSFFESLLDLSFIHHSNNLFLMEFARLIYLTMIFKRRILKRLFLENKMLQRFIDFYAPNRELLCYGFIRKKAEMLNIYIPSPIYNVICIYYPKYYDNARPRTELHCYILQILWQIYKNDIVEDDEKSEELIDAQVLKSNMSTEAEDQWDIISYLNNNIQWRDFYGIISSEIKKQQSGESSWESQDNTALDALLGTYNDDSSDSDSDGEGDLEQIMQSIQM